jgi:hypothetical protein
MLSLKATPEFAEEAEIPSWIRLQGSGGRFPRGLETLRVGELGHDVAGGPGRQYVLSVNGGDGPSATAIP